MSRQGRYQVRQALRSAPVVIRRILILVAFTAANANGFEANKLPASCVLPAGLARAIESSSSGDGYGAAGAWFAEQHQTKCASAAFKISVRLDPKSWQSFYNLGVLGIEAHDAGSAEQNLRQSLQLKPDLAPAHDALGSVLAEAGKRSEAEVEFKKALQSAPDSVSALDHLAQLLSDEGRYSAAIAYWDRLLAIEPGKLDVQVAVAVAYSNNGDAQRAITMLVSLLKRHPELDQAHFDLGTI